VGTDAASISRNFGTSRWRLFVHVTSDAGPAEGR
jgi:hypothetical protein